MVPPCSDRISRVPPYSWIKASLPRTGLSPTQARLSSRFRSLSDHHWPGPRSLATTNGVSLMSFPPGTEMFQFPGFAFVPYLFRYKSFVSMTSKQRSQTRFSSSPRSLFTDHWKGVAPFGNPWIKARSRLPKAYRSVPRPSSPLSTKASTRYP